MGSGCQWFAASWRCYLVQVRKVVHSRKGCEAQCPEKNAEQGKLETKGRWTYCIWKTNNIKPKEDIT